MSQFDTFTERARKVLTLAQEEALRLNHHYIGTEHLLLGLVRERDDVAARVLNNMGVQLPKVRSAVEFIIGRGDVAVVGELSLTPRSKRIIELAIDEARQLNHHYIGTEHLLLGLIREGEGIGAGVLESLGVNLDTVRAWVMREVGESLALTEKEFLDIQHVIKALTLIEQLFAYNVPAYLIDVLNAHVVWPLEKLEQATGHPATLTIMRSLLAVGLQPFHAKHGRCSNFRALHGMATGLINISEHAEACPYCKLILVGLVTAHKQVKVSDSKEESTPPPETLPVSAPSGREQRIADEKPDIP